MAEVLLNSTQMAEFAALGYVRMDAVVPNEINELFLTGLGDGGAETPADQYALLRESSTIPVVQAGVPFKGAYPEDSALGQIVNLPRVSGAIRSLVGADPVFDHHFLHMTFPPRFTNGKGSAQHLHQDSTIDPRRAFDIQLMYYPEQVTADMGGTRFIPGSHLRVVSESSIGRYQNMKGQQQVVCEAGTLLFMHMGIWHGGGRNDSDQLRHMFKIRLCPRERQCRLWDDSDLGNDHSEQRPIFWRDDSSSRDPVQAILTHPQPWFEADTGRLEYINRIRFWRYLLGDEDYDADYWVTRVENEYP